MSATTILESYDTQMDYSGDFDVAMLTAGSSADAWLYQSETIMDQDAHQDSQSTGAGDRESVEVEMEETYPDHADNESVEYEMADEEEIYQHEAGDLLDVEVYDASQLHSPVPMPAIIDTPQMTSSELVDFTIRSTTAFTDPRNSVETPTVPQDETHLHEPSATGLPLVETIPYSSPRFEVHEALPDVGEAAESHTDNPVDSSTATQTDSDRLLHTALETEAAVEINESSNSGATPVGDSSHAHGEVTELVHIWPQAQDHEAAAHLGQPTGAERPEPEEYHDEVQHYYEYNEPTANAADPHEISEGVYIDPPPAVLLSLPSTDQPEVCLFNQPPTRAESLSPSEGTHPPEQQVLTLLLHHRPTLYYEPLVNVFEALRQEEYITRIPESAEGELALDAYDLQLIISEDNAHAREITLHDLNVLHDGSDLSGSLRLQLQLTVPRFIIRYHMLRDQVARLNLAAEGEECEQVIAQHEHRDEHAEEYHDPEDYNNPEENPEENNEDYQSQQQYHEHSEDHAGRLTDRQAISDISNLTAEDQVYGDEAQALEDERTFVDANADADTESNLYQEDIGENPNADYNNLSDSVTVAVPGGDAEPTEYEDYTEAKADDEHYSEAFPEQEGSNNQALDYHVAQDEESTDAGNAQEAITEPDIEQATPTVDLTEPIGDQPATEGSSEESLEVINKNNAEVTFHDDLDHDFVGAVTKHTVHSVDESDSNVVAILEHEADLTDSEAETSTSKPELYQEPELQYPDPDDDHEWDDDLDAEGEIDASWPVDNDDDVSNQSSATLSSTTSNTKRGYDELDPEDEFEGDGRLPQNDSPTPKRPRVA